MEHVVPDARDTVERELLRVVAADGPTYPTVAARRTTVSPSTAADHYATLADAGLVERVTAEPVYRITDAGRELLAGTERARRSVTGD